MKEIPACGDQRPVYELLYKAAGPEARPLHVYRISRASVPTTRGADRMVLSCISKLQVAQPSLLGVHQVTVSKGLYSTKVGKPRNQMYTVSKLAHFW